MKTNDMSMNNAKVDQNNKETKNLPIYNVKWLTDEEWNRLAYRNYLQRKHGLV